MGAVRNIVIVSGSRADYGLLYWPMRRIAAAPEFRLSIIATGMHLSEDFGMTVDQFGKDGFVVAERVPILVGDDSALGVARAIGRATAGCAEALENLQPDIVLLAGDRYEILAAAQAAFVARVPIAHLFGGDITRGAMDDAFRNAISLMATLHFPSNAESAERLKRLGAPDAMIFNIGSTGLDYLRQAQLPDRHALEVALGHSLASRYLLVTFHPVTLDSMSSEHQLESLLAALAALPPEIGLVFTLANADPGGLVINKRIEAFTHERADVRAHVALGSTLYLGLMHHAAAVVGNSSSGLYEAPSFGIPTVNIGRRQEGRLRADSVIDCPPRADEIGASIVKALSMNGLNVVNPYGDGHASERLVSVLKNFFARSSPPHPSHETPASPS